MRPEKETELCRVVADYLRADCWHVYQEVEGPGRIDLYAKRGTITWAIETKLSFTFKALEQVFRWRGKAHFISVAIPSINVSAFGAKLCLDNGIGILHVANSSVCRKEEGSLWRRPILPALHEEQKSCEGGNNRNYYFSPFRSTRRALYEFVASNRGTTLKDAIASLKHHYSSDKSAVSSLRALIGSGSVPELRLERDGKSLRLFTTETDPPKFW